jgi:general secretion pathway protein H
MAIVKWGIGIWMEMVQKQRSNILQREYNAYVKPLNTRLVIGLHETSPHLTRHKTHLSYAVNDSAVSSSHYDKRQDATLHQRPFLQTTSKRKHNQHKTSLNAKAGFTLIELLIVIVIISIVSSVALLTISHNQNKNIENFSHEFVHLMTLAEHEAMLRPATLGLAFTDSSYQFYIYKPGMKWQPLTDKNLNLHRIPNKTHITLKMNNKIIALNGKPIIIISESGDITPFEILLGEPEKYPTYEITGQANGIIKSEAIHAE